MALLRKAYARQPLTTMNIQVFNYKSYVPRHGLLGVLRKSSTNLSRYSLLAPRFWLRQAISISSRDIPQSFAIVRTIVLYIAFITAETTKVALGFRHNVLWK